MNQPKVFINQIQCRGYLRAAQRVPHLLVLSECVPYNDGSENAFQKSMPSSFFMEVCSFVALISSEE